MADLPEKREWTMRSWVCGTGKRERVVNADYTEAVERERDEAQAKLAAVEEWARTGTGYAVHRKHVLSLLNSQPPEGEDQS